MSRVLSFIRYDPIEGTARPGDFCVQNEFSRFIRYDPIEGTASVAYDRFTGTSQGVSFGTTRLRVLQARHKYDQC